ncbi:Endonuclease/exonuclease/phosphatase [Phellopilus nigrolimitatus]|nr:Endonuclease/exonuclease/phosphatase [Phellopilus nigrolimitatus]
MPPKPAASSSKRKATPSSDGEVGPTRTTSKKVKATKGASSSANVEVRDGFAANGQPTNKVLPVHIEFPEKIAGSIRIASWNVSGLAACQKKGFKFYVEAEDPDVLILTETKMNDEPDLSVLTERYPYRHWSIATKKGYAGTAVLSKYEPLSITKTLPGHPSKDAVNGRILTLEFEKFYLVGTYVTNAGQGLKTLKEKEEWNEHFEEYIRDLDEKKPVVWAGDLNVAPTEKDLTNAKRNWNKTPGYTESETKAFARILNPSTTEEASDADKSANRFIDVWRHLHPDDQHYTYFGYRFNCRSKGIGWRLDMFVLSERLLNSVKMCEIRSEIYGASDHCPVVMEIGGLV